MKYSITLFICALTTLSVLAVPKSLLSFAEAEKIANYAIRGLDAGNMHFLVSMELSFTPTGWNYLVDYNASAKAHDIRASGAYGTDGFIEISYLGGDVRFIKRRWHSSWRNRAGYAHEPKRYYSYEIDQDETIYHTILLIPIIRHLNFNEIYRRYNNWLYVEDTLRQGITLSCARWDYLLQSPVIFEGKTITRLEQYSLCIPQQPSYIWKNGNLVTTGDRLY